MGWHPSPSTPCSACSPADAREERTPITRWPRPHDRYDHVGSRRSSSPLGRRWRRRQHARFNLGLESILGMCAIAKWFIIASAAATQGDIFPPWCTERGAASVAQLDIAFDAQWTIVSDRDFPRHTHLPSLGVHPSDRTTNIDREGRATGLFPRLFDYITNRFPSGGEICLGTYRIDR